MAESRRGAWQGSPVARCCPPVHKLQRPGGVYATHRRSSYLPGLRPRGLRAARPCARRRLQVLVDILKQDWPHKWPSFIPDIVGASKTNETLCENSMAILRLLSEEVFDFSKDSLTAVGLSRAGCWVLAGAVFDRGVYRVDLTDLGAGAIGFQRLLQDSDQGFVG